VQFIDRLKQDGATWVRNQNFWMFGTATFKNGTQMQDNDAVADAKHFFNILDRLVFLEHGKLGANTHIYFFIKGTQPIHQRQHWTRQHTQRILLEGNQILSA